MTMTEAEKRTELIGIRRALGLTQQRLAEELGLGASGRVHISKMETGLRGVPDRMLRAARLLQQVRAAHPASPVPDDTEDAVRQHA
jgi:transcriptional regulator with XRE-family HTH domain